MSVQTNSLNQFIHESKGRFVADVVKFLLGVPDMMLVVVVVNGTFLFLAF